MLLLVTGLSLIIQLFSTSYMEKDEKYINYLSKFENQGAYEKAIFNTLKIYTSTFKNKKLSHIC